MSATFATRSPSSRAASSFYTQTVDPALAEIDRLPGRHLYFLDDHLFGECQICRGALRRNAGNGTPVAGRRNREVGARTRAAGEGGRCGLRSLFVGFETLNRQPSRAAKYQNLRRDYSDAIRRLHDLGVMVNGSFVFGMDDDDPTVFDRTVEWAVEHGIETATFHILTPYPGTALYRRMAAEGRLRCTTGTSTTRVTRSSSPRECRHAARGRLLARVSGVLSLGIDLARRRRARRCARACATWRTRQAGRSSSRCGTSSSGRSDQRRCCPCWRRSSASLAAANLRHAKEPYYTCNTRFLMVARWYAIIAAMTWQIHPSVPPEPIQRPGVTTSQNRPRRKSPL